MLCCLCFVLILHGAEVFSAHSSAQQRTAAHSCFGTQLRKLLRQSCKMLGTLRQSYKMLGTQFWDTIFDPFGP